MLYIVGDKKKGPPKTEGLKKEAVYAKSVPKLMENAMQKVDQTKEKCSMQEPCQS